ncbi:hypothetical protein Clacol_002076 [Clathrus columnatus]|uniref:Uncharacterized protein n=1 Tax=Clathrus columnatus TaxID=1419009 RepID=A0AAV5A7I7_9AGAM|nr:hypothetical protein Clacol_002076 [Clathrus columnatus]
MHKISQIPEILDEIFLYSSKHTNTIIAQAALYHPSSTDLFSSKLTILTWKGVWEHVNCLIPFLSPMLQVLLINLDVMKNMDLMDALCKTIVFRSPLLCSFELTVPPTGIQNHTAQISHSLSQLMPFLLDLILVAFPIHFMTPELFKILSCLPRLEDLLLSATLNAEYVENLPRCWKVTIVQEDSSEEFLPFHSLQDFHIYDHSDNSMFTATIAFSQGIQFFTLTYLSCSQSLVQQS